MSNEKKQEYTLKIANANKSKMIVILYEMTLIYLDDAINASRQKDQKNFLFALTKVRGCLKELIASLDFHYEVAMRMFELYIFVTKEVARAERKRELAHLDNSKKIIGELAKAYQKISESDASAPLMQNAQEVYVGMTYGRNQVEECYAKAMGRGFAC